MMRFAFGLFLACLAIVPGVALAQKESRFPSTPSPPPLPHSPQNPVGGPSSPPPAPPPPPPGPAKPPPGGNALGGLVGYMDAKMQAGPYDIEAPVTGYGNEALWDVGSAFDNPSASDAVSTPPSSDSTGSTAGGPNR